MHYCSALETTYSEIIERLSSSFKKQIIFKVKLIIQIKFSVMHPGTHVWPHCGPTNCRLRAHLGLIVPSEPRIRVATVTKTWKEGKFIVFDDSFEHEVWHMGSSLRLILIVDFWHPEVTPQERANLSPI